MWLSFENRRKQAICSLLFCPLPIRGVEANLAHSIPERLLDMNAMPKGHHLHKGWPSSPLPAESAPLPAVARAQPLLQYARRGGDCPTP